MSKINIRESLKHLDEDTFCRYDLTTMYDSCVLDDEDKKVLAKMLYDKEDPEVIYQKLCMYFDDDQVADIDSYLMDTPVEGKYESLINKCVNKLSESYKDVSYNDVANQLEFNNGEQAYTIGVCPFEDVDTDDYEVFIDYNYDSPCCFNSEDEALKYILNFIKNKVNHIDDSDVQNCDDEMVYTVYDIVEDDDNRLVAKCMNESTNDFEDIKLGKTNTNRVIELINNLLNNPNYKITKETKDKIYKNSAPWGLAVQMTPSVDVDGTNGLLTTGDFGGDVSFGESVEINFEKNDRVTDGDREGTVIDSDSQKALVEWDYSDTDDIEWVDKSTLDFVKCCDESPHTFITLNSINESESEIGYYHISYNKNGIYQSLIIKANNKDDAENKFKNMRPSAKLLNIFPIINPVELDSYKKRHVPIKESINITESDNVEFKYAVIEFVEGGSYDTNPDKAKVVKAYRNKEKFTDLDKLGDMLYAADTSLFNLKDEEYGSDKCYIDFYGTVNGKDVIYHGSSWDLGDGLPRAEHIRNEDILQIEELLQEESDNELIESSNMYFTCPSCGNKTLSSIDSEVKIPADVDYHDKFICDECGEEFLSEPQFNGKIKFVYNNLNESIPLYKKEEFKKQLQDELYDKMIKLFYTPEWGYENIKEIDDFINPVIDIEDYKGEYDNDIKVEFRAELNYPELEEVGEVLNKVIQKYDKNSYFEPVEGGIADAYLKFPKGLREDFEEDTAEHLMDLIEDEVSGSVIDYYIDNFGKSFIVVYNNNLNNIRNEAINLSDILTKNGYKVRDWNTNGNNVVILRFAKPISLNEDIEDEKNHPYVGKKFQYFGKDSGSNYGKTFTVTRAYDTQNGVTVRYDSEDGHQTITAKPSEYKLLKDSKSVKRKGKLITAINESFSSSGLRQANIGLSYNSIRYKGYRISLLTDGSGYAIFDKHGEMEDHGFKSIKDAKSAIDEFNSIYKPVLSKGLSEASYGGAFDIEDDQYFTKEDIMDLADEVCERLYKEVHETFDISDLYMDGNTLHMELESDSCMVETNVKIDMRKIRKPLDIMKYALPITNKLLSQVKDCYNY